MSTLFHQLQHLKVAGQPSSLHVTAKKRPSLLFDHEEAATIDIEVIYDLGRNGLEELIKIDNSLTGYEENLFSENCMSYERSVQEKEQIKQLDETIARFLRLLSPYLMLRAAHKCLEWLIRVFRINSYNVDSIMECMLPYHDTILFARILQLLPLKSKSSAWHWLRPAQKKGSPLAKSTLIQHCVSVPSFLSFVCGMVERCCNKVAVNFYCSTVVSVLSVSAVLEESLVVMVIPHITNGLKSSHDHIKAANYIILAHMIQRTTLSDKVSNSLLNILTKNLSESLMKEGIMLLCIYCNYQQLKTLPSRTIKYLAGCPQLLPTLSDIGASHDVLAFSKLLITSLITSHFDKMISSHGNQASSPDVVVGVLKTVPLEEAIVVQCGRLLLECYMKHRDMIGQDDEDDTPLLLDHLQHYCGPIIKLIDTRYPSVMDIIIGSDMTSCDPHHQKWAQDFVVLSLQSLKHNVVMDTSVVTAVGIHHGNSHVRRSTLSNLCQQIGSGKTENIEDKEFVSSAVLSHLRDDSNLVVENAVSCCVRQKKMLQCIPVDSLTDALFSVLGRARSHDPVSEQCLQDVISLLSSIDQFTDSMLLRLLPHLLYRYHDNVKVIQSVGAAIATSRLSQTHPMLVGSDKLFYSIDYQIQSSDDSDVMNNVNCHLIGHFAKRLSSMETHHLITMVNLLLDMCHHDDDVSVSLKPSFLFSVAMVTQLITYSLSSSLNIRICTNLVSMVSSITPHCVLENLTPSLNNAMITLAHKIRSHRKHARCCSNLVSWIIAMVTKHLVIIADKKASLWLDMRSCDLVDYQQYCVVLLMLYNLLIRLLSNSSQQCIDNCHSMMKTFINIHFQGRGTLLRFLAMIWCAQPDTDLDKPSLFSLHTQISSLRYALVFLEAMGPGDLLAVGGVPQCPMVPALLVALLKPDKSLRQAALKCFQLIHASIGVTGVNIMNVDTPFLYLCDVVLHHQVELEVDHNAVLVAMAKGMNTVTMATDKSIISAVVKALMHHVTSHDTPTHIQCSLLTIIRNVYHKIKFDGVMKMLKRKLDIPSSDDQPSDQEVIKELIKCYNINNTTFITSDAVNILTRLLNVSNTILNLVLRQITGEFYTSLTAHHQQLILSSLLDLCLCTNTTPAVSTAIVNVINKLSLNINNVLNELDKKQLLIKEKSVGSNKSKRIKLDTSTREEMSLDESWQRVGIILDTIPGSVSSHDCYQLVPTLFELLESCLELDTTLHHIQLQLLIVLCWIVTTMMAHVGVEKARELLPESKFNVDLIVQTIRSSSSTPQIQQQSLTLLSQSASLYPARILHNIMSIFTFMGVYLSHHDDQYSFKIVLGAMDSLLPMLMSSDISHTPKKLSNQIAVTAIEIIRVFSDAIQHIPDHRQLIVFEKLVNILGADDYLHVTLLMLLGKQVAKQQQDNQEKKTILEFCKQLSNEFPTVTQVMSLHKVMEYVSCLPDVQAVRKTGSARKIAMVTAGEIFNLYTHSTKQIQQYKLFVSLSVISILSCEEFTSKLVNNGVSMEQEMMFISLLQTTISYIVTINAHRNTGKFHDLLMKRCYAIVDHVTHPLTTKSYIKVMSQLIMPGAHCDIQRRSLDIICSHFTSSSRHFASSNVTDTLTLLPLLNQLIQQKQLPSDNAVSAISLITTIVQSIGSGYHDNIIEVIPHLLKMIKKKSTPNQVLACSIKCVSKMIRNIGGHFIPHLPSALPLILSKVSSHDSSIAVMAIDGLISVIEVLPQFLSPYVSDIIIKGCHAAVATGDLITVITAAEHLREQVAAHVPSRMLIPKLLQCYDQVAMDTAESILSFLHILRSSINKLSTTDVGSYSNELTDLFLKLLQHRSTQQQEAVVDVEEKCIECFTQLVVKMSENTFRPVFLKISDWATQSKSKDHMISFYHLADQIAGKLKGLFLLFAGHIIPNCVELLSSISEDDHQLLQYLLSCLTKCFHYDTTNSFLTNNRFNALLKPLITQVHVITDDDTIHNYLVPCLMEFAAATNVDGHWKNLNHQLLLYSKDDSSKVRQSVLHILMALYNKLGESLLILLPETIPFLAELLEDEDEEVEQLCRKFIKIVEELLGESIQQYF